MKQSWFALLLFSMSMVLVGCGGSDTATTQFTDDELQAHAEKHPVTIIGEDGSGMEPIE